VQTPFINQATHTRGFEFESRAGFLTTSENFSPNRTSLPNNGSAQRFTLDNWLRYRTESDLTLFARFSIAQAQYSSLSTQNIALTQFGMSDQMVGANLELSPQDRRVRFALQTEVTFPFYSNSSSVLSNSPYLGDGSVDVLAGPVLSVDLDEPRTVVASTGISYQYRSKGFSAGIPWFLGVEYEPSQDGILLGARLTGQVSLKNDVSTNNSTLTLQATADQLRGAGGSALINGINSSWTELWLLTGYKINSSVSLPISGSLVLGGTQAPNAYQGFAGLKFSFGSERQRGSSPTPPVVNYRKNKFQSYDLEAAILTVDEDLHVLKIGKGSVDGVKNGQFFDIFEESKPIARAQVIDSKKDESALSVIEYFQERWIEPGQIVRRLKKE
jgi:hypothetical protein